MTILNDLANAWLQPFLVHLFEFSVFISIIWFVDTVLRLKTNVRYWMWFAALTKIFIPPIVQMPHQVESIPLNVYLLQPIPLTIPAETTYALSTSAWFMLAWFVTVLAFTILFRIKHQRLQQALANAQSIDLSQLEITQLNSINNLRLFVSESLQTPLLTGILRPKLYLPASFRSWPAAQLRSVLQHELAHLKNRDLWALSMQILALTLFGFHPLVWLLHHRLLHLRELRCDESALRETGIHPTEYSRFLYSILEQQNKPKLGFVGSISFAEDSQAIFKRFSHIFEISKKGVQKMRWWHYLVVITVCAAILPLSWQCSNKKMLTEPEDAAFAKQSGEIVKFDTAPMPAGGFKTIQENLIYPDQARKEGLEGKVILNVLITENGDVEDINILKSLSKGCDDAAIAAVKLTKWQPAKSKDTPVKVWVGIPVVFRLNENKPSDPHGATAIPTDKDGKLTVLGQPSDKRFAAWDEPPKPVDGFAAVQKNLRYPELARKAGIEGRVILNVLIGSDGVVKETKVLQDLAEGNNGCAEAASDAVKATQWQPAQKDGKLVDTWVAIPVIFKLQ